MKVRKLLDSTAIVAYSKSSGLLRDMTIVFMFGLSEISDAIFFCMSFIMLFQLSSYLGNINILGSNANLYRFYKLVSSRKYLVFIICLIVTAISGLGFERLMESGFTLLHSYLICFIGLVPFSMAIGIVASYRVLEGDRNYHVIVVCIQNTFFLIFSSMFYFNFNQQYIFLTWFLGCAAIFLTLKSTVIKKSLILEKSDHGLSGLTYSFLSPVLMLSIVLTERWFYSGVEGSVGLIKILETGALAVIFLMEVVFLNPVLSELAKNEDKRDIEKRYALLSVFKKVFPLGSLLMAAFIVLVIMSKDHFFKPSNATSEISDFFVVLSFLYFLYFVSAMIRDYLERYFFLVRRPGLVFKLNVVILISTLVINSIFLSMAPLSVTIIAILLMIGKDIFLILNTAKVKSVVVSQ